MGICCDMAGLLDAGTCIRLEIGVDRILQKDASHALQDMRIDISCNHAEIGRDLALDLCALDQMALVVDLLDDPDSTGNGDALADRRWLHDRAKLLGLASDRELLIRGKDRIEAEVIDLPFAGEANDEAAALGALYLVDIQKMPEEHLVVLERHPMERRQGQHLACQLLRCHLA